MIEANSQDEAKMISVSCQTLTLNAGYMFDEGDGHVLILPSERLLFDQVLYWLNTQPEPPYLGLLHYIHGIEAAALCLRWGTYLAVLMDHNKPVDSRTNDQSIRVSV